MLPMVRQLMPFTKLRALVSLNMVAKVGQLSVIIEKENGVGDKCQGGARLSPYFITTTFPVSIETSSDTSLYI